MAKYWKSLEGQSIKVLFYCKVNTVSCYGEGSDDKRLERSLHFIDGLHDHVQNANSNADSKDTLRKENHPIVN